MSTAFLSCRDTCLERLIHTIIPAPTEEPSRPYSCISRRQTRALCLRLLGRRLRPVQRPIAVKERASEREGERGEAREREGERD
jgi:hypothetical protein